VADGKGGGGGFVTGLLLGLLGGTALAMITTPKTGEDTRATLGIKAREGARVAGDVGESLSGQTNELLERGRMIVERARARVDGAVAEGMLAAEQQRNELQSRT
jgi:gas vesicle protein